MKRITGILAGATVLAFTAGFAIAEDQTTTPQAGTTTTPGTAQQAPDQAAPPATTAPATPEAASQPAPADPAQAAAPVEASQADPLARIREEGAKLDAKVQQKFDSKLETTVGDVEKSATTDGDRRVAERLGNEFGITADALVAEKNDLKVGWGQLLIAHTLMSNSTTELTARQIFDLKGGGMGWGQISTGLGLKLGEVMSAAQAEARVAKGLAKADGKVAVIHGAGSRSGMGPSVAAKASKGGGKPAADAAAASKTKTDTAVPGQGVGAEVQEQTGAGKK